MVWTSRKPDSVVDEHDGVRSKPLKRRSLSQFYNSKSQSFSSLDLVFNGQFGESTLALGKPLRRLSSPIEPDNWLNSQGLGKHHGITNTSSFWLRKTTEDICAALRLTRLSNAAAGRPTDSFLHAHHCVTVGQESE